MLHAAILSEAFISLECSVLLLTLIAYFYILLESYQYKACVRNLLTIKNNIKLRNSTTFTIKYVCLTFLSFVLWLNIYIIEVSYLLDCLIH